MFILFMPMMILGGGLEEIGWQGVFQPLLQMRFPFLIAALIEGIIWSIWHLPLWLVPNTAQSSYQFVAFTLFCVTLGITLAAAHKITKSIWVSDLLHNFLVRFPKSENLDCQSGSNSGDYVYIACFFSEKD